MFIGNTLAHPAWIPPYPTIRNITAIDGQLNFMLNAPCTIYWIEIISYLNRIDSFEVEEIYSEANEILSIFTSVGKKLIL